MKYKFSIIAPHPDDEFIGCYKFIKKYTHCIDNIIFMTNGEHSVDSIPDMLERIKTRRLESENWISQLSNKIQIHYMNILDGIDIIEIKNMYGSEIFEAKNNTTITSYLRDKLIKIIGNNYVLCPASLDSIHPTHLMTKLFCDTIPNKKIYYFIHQILKQSLQKKSGVYIGRIKFISNKYFDYTYVHNEESLLLKRKEFEEYYSSQFEELLRNDLYIENWEKYISSIPLSLCNEDKVYKV